jgi:excisionase family DNA binding protein
MTTDRYVTTTEAASRLGLTVSGVRIACQRGTMRAEKIGRDWLIPESEVAWYELRSLGRRFGRPPKNEKSARA